MGQKHQTKNVDPVPLEPQPAALADLLTAINAARRQISLYGAGHPNVAQSATDLAGVFKGFADVFGRCTLVLTRTTALANEHSYSGSSESEELFRRLRARGVMAMTVVTPPSPDQITAFLGFLNAEPQEVRSQGGASAALRKRGVSVIVATDAVYTSGDEADDSDDSPHPSANPADMDRALGEAVNWLLRQDEEEDEAPRLPIMDILSRPDEAAKLIREAVTKLHASRRQETRGEIASEVVHDLKDLASDAQDKWDSATPQIRKAMSKLPKGMRPEVAGFTEENDLSEDKTRVHTSHLADIFEVEAQVAEVLEQSLDSDSGQTLPAPDAFSSLFGASACGLLSSWRKELQPGMVMGSSGKTLETLMTQETRGMEHERIARALAGLLPRAIEMKDFGSARAIADSLMREVRQGDAQDWRAVNARSALQSMDKAMLKQVVQACASSSDLGARQSTNQLVEMLPELALQMIDQLGKREYADLDQSLVRGITKCGAAAVGPLGRVIAEGSDAARDLALDALLQTGTAAALREIGRALPEADEAFTIRALTRLPEARHPQAVETCTQLLSSRSAGVRCAALAALGELAVPASAEAIIRAATRRGLSDEDMTEKKTALEALGCLDSEEAKAFLERTAARHPLFGKKRYETIRVTAERALAQMNGRATSERQAA